jgi:hypothetical protein
MPNSAKQLINASIATSSWKKHLAARKSFENFEIFQGKKSDWPLADTHICEYISWAILKKGLRASTVKSYISSLTFLHKLHGLDSSGCESFLTNTALQGAVNLEFYSNMTRNVRKVMTLPLLKILGHQLATSELSKFDRQIFWSACLLAFFGSLRFSEILPPADKNFHAKEIFLWKDIAFKEDSVILKIKIPKSRTPQGEIVDLFEIRNSSVCPVKALLNLKSKLGQSFNPNAPVFTFEDSSYLTLPVLNSLLLKLLHPVIGEEARAVTAHSFRAALPSALANSPEIASEADIRLWGRWNSSAYKKYTRLKPRQKRVIFSKILASLENL